MRRYEALLAAGVMLVLSCSTTTVAQAVAPACSTVVTDDAGVLSPADLAALRKHSAGLAATTELRIRTERSLFTGTLNGDEGSLQQDCQWATRVGVRQPRLLVVMVATESRQVGIYPGTALVGTLTKKVLSSIEQKDIRPHLARHDWLGGLEAGVDALASTVATTSPPQSAPAVPTAAPSATDAAASHDAGADPLPSETDANVVQDNGDVPTNINGPSPSGGLDTASVERVAVALVVVLLAVASFVFRKYVRGRLGGGGGSSG